MRNNSGANHVQIDINKTTVQVLVSLNRSGMISVFPKCAVASFALIVFLPSAASDQLHAISDNICTGVSPEAIRAKAAHVLFFCSER
jgi:hypothetical protein